MHLHYRVLYFVPKMDWAPPLEVVPDPGSAPAYRMFGKMEYMSHRNGNWIATGGQSADPGRDIFLNSLQLTSVSRRLCRRAEHGTKIVLNLWRSCCNSEMFNSLFLSIFSKMGVLLLETLARVSRVGTKGPGSLISPRSTCAEVFSSLPTIPTHICFPLHLQEQVFPSQIPDPPLGHKSCLRMEMLPWKLVLRIPLSLSLFASRDESGGGRSQVRTQEMIWREAPRLIKTLLPP